MSTIIYVDGQKGGTSKTTTAHLLCLGAVLKRQPAAYVLTDPHRRVKSEGRPYGVLDGRDGNALAQVITSSRVTQNGWLIIDGGGNRPSFDQVMTRQADLTLLPFRASEEDTDAVALDLDSLPNAIALPAAWPTNRYAGASAQRLIEELSARYPDRVVSSPVDFVNSTAELVGTSLDNSASVLRYAARSAFALLQQVWGARANSLSRDTAA